MDFERWYKAAYPDMAASDHPGNQAVRKVAEAAWNDGRQLLLAAIVFKLAGFKKKAVSAAEETEKPAVRRTLAALLLDLADMEV